MGEGGKSKWARDEGVGGKSLGELFVAEGETKKTRAGDVEREKKEKRREEPLVSDPRMLNQEPFVPVPAVGG